MATYTGIQRKRATTRAVLVMDRLARWTITFGGIGTILSVCLVCVFLFWVVLPLLLPGTIAAEASTQVPAAGKVVHFAEDEYRQAAIVVGADGNAIAFATGDGTHLQRMPVFDPAVTTAVQAHGERILCGRNDGSLQLVAIGFQNSGPDHDDVPAAVRDLPLDASRVLDGKVYTHILERKFRAQELAVTPRPPLLLGTASSVLRCDWSEPPRGRVYAALTADETLHLKVESTRMSLLTGEDEVTLTGADVPLRDVLAKAPQPVPTRIPDHLFLNGAGDNVLLIWRDGTLLRLDIRDIEAPAFAEAVDLAPADEDVASLAFLIGKTTLLVGDRHGTVHAWFGTKPEAAGTSDGVRFVAARAFAFGEHGAALAIGASKRSRLFAVAHRDGTVQVLQGTSGRLVAEAHLPAGAVPERVTILPKEDGVAVLAGGQLHRFAFDAGHPEVSVGAAFRPVWYEGAPGPEHVWQSSSGSDDFESKFGLWVLVFGTLKATIYCLLFGVPIALLAAIYTSEFLHTRWRARIKPAVELMASLPSVVLGFLAALVIAPIVADHLVAILCAVFVIPLTFLFGAQLWQLLPTRSRPLADRMRPLAACIALVVGILLALGIGPFVEGLFFRGDFKGWLALGAGPTATNGSPFGGWFLVLLPLGALVAFLLVGRVAGERNGRTAPLNRFLIGTVATVAITALLAFALGLGFDLRGSVFGVYDQRNSLITGFVMGFAVVPIIYTIAEDALSAVPEHLRAASLGAGATQWQTAIRIVLPTAMSGVFSAIMVGLGRAVGETMIVVMATGSTPVLDWNVFNGFRTLSACIAIELPETVRNSTHYRMLYLAALCLFVLTFVLNTIAEVVRQRFRKRAYQL